MEKISYNGVEGVFYSEKEAKMAQKALEFIQELMSKKGEEYAL